MISLAKLRARHAKPIDGLHAFAIDVRMSPKAPLTRYVQYAHSLQDATDRIHGALAHEDRGKGQLFAVRQLSGPVRVYKLGRGMAL